MLIRKNSSIFNNVRKNSTGVFSDSTPLQSVILTDDLRYYGEMQAERKEQLLRAGQGRLNPEGDIYSDTAIERWIFSWLENQNENRTQTMQQLCEAWLPALAFAKASLPFQGDSNVQHFMSREDLRKYDFSQKEFEAPFIMIYYATVNIFFSIINACKQIDPTFVEETINDYISNEKVKIKTIINVERSNFANCCRQAEFDPESEEDISNALSIADLFQISEFKKGINRNDPPSKRFNKVICDIIMDLVKRTVSEETNFLSRHFWALEKYASMFIGVNAPSLDYSMAQLQRLDFKVFLNFSTNDNRLFEQERRTLGAAVLANLNFIKNWSNAIGGQWLEEDVEATFRSRGRKVEILLQEVSDRSLSAENKASQAVECCQVLFSEIRPLANSIYPFIPFDLIYLERLARRGDTVSEIASLMNCSESLIESLLTKTFGFILTDEKRLQSNDIKYYAKKSHAEVEAIKNAYIKSNGNMQEIKKLFKRNITIDDFTDFRRLFNIEDVEKRSYLEEFKKLRWGSSIYERDSIAADYMSNTAQDIIERINKGYYGALPKGRSMYPGLFRKLMSLYCPAVNFSALSTLRPKMLNRSGEYYR